MELGLEETSGDERGVALGCESDGSTGLELGDHVGAIGIVFCMESRLLAEGSAGVELGPEFGSDVAGASSDALAAKVPAGKRRQFGKSAGRIKRARTVGIDRAPALAFSHVCPAKPRVIAGASTRCTASRAETRAVARSMAELFEWAHAAMSELVVRFGETAYQRLAHRRWRISTHFSGLGTVEVALAMLKAASPATLRGVLIADVISSCELSPALRGVLGRRSHGCLFANVFERIEMGEGSVPSLNEIDNARVADTCTCQMHGTDCRIQGATMEVSGSSCRPWSRMNRGQARGVAHPDYQAFKAWVQLMRHDSPPIIIHENVVGFPLKIMEEELGDLFEVTRLSVTPDDVGFGFMSRQRVYDVLFLRGVVSGPDLREVYEVVVQRLRKDVRSWPDWVWKATPGELTAELCSRCRPEESMGVDAWTASLTLDQQAYIARYSDRWTKARGSIPADDAHCVFDLSITPEFRGVHVGDVLPTMRRRAAAWWSPSRSRWMLPREKAACMGFPVYDDLARAARVPLDIETIGLIAGNACPIGNAMHVANVGVVMLAAMFAAAWQ